MLRTNKNKNIVSTLYDRQLNNTCEPYILSLNIISQLLRSDAELYKRYWKKSSKRPISYDSGYLYFNDYTICFTMYGKNTPSLLFHLQKTKARKKISDVISYSVPVYKTFDECICNNQHCVCFSQYLWSISEDNWLCKHSMETGKLLLEIYANRFNKQFRFKYCDWDVYSERFILTSTLNPELKDTVSKKSNVVLNLAIFHAVPFEFFALLEIKRSVFGESCNAANVSDQHLIIGIGSTRVHIYNFVDFIKQGNLISYKLGDEYENGKIGFYPTGIPLNFTYAETSPLLFNVQCYGQVVRFGGYPYHYITSSPKNSQHFSVRSIESNTLAEGGSLESQSFHPEDSASLSFHPDHSNRLLFRDSNVIYCYQLRNCDSTQTLFQHFTMKFPQAATTTRRDVSSFGRRIKTRTLSKYYPCNVFCMDYANELDVLAIMGKQQGDFSSDGFIKLYDSFTGDEIRTLKLKDEVYDSNFYQLFIDMGEIILIERKDRLVFTVHVYNM